MCVSGKVAYCSYRRDRRRDSWRHGHRRDRGGHGVGARPGGAPGRPEALAGAALGTIAFVLVIFVAPLTVFITPLMRAWEGGVVIYGALAQRIGVALEDKWMHGPPAEETADPLSTGDFSAATDFYQTANNVYTMRIMPLDLRGLLALAVATALPFSIVVLALVPFDKLLQKLIGMFL
jgi:hypothetical protein